MVDGSPGSGEIINTLGADFGALLNVQTAARMLSQLEFFCGLGMKVADAIGITGFLHVQEKLGEMLSQMEIARAVFYGAEAMAQRLPERRVGAGRPRAPRLPPPDRQGLQPLRRDRADPGRGRLLLRADRGRPRRARSCGRTSTGTCAAAPGVSAEERIALFKLAWDVTGEAFAQRMAQYVRFYSGDPIRLTAGFYTQYDKAPLLELVERALGRRDGDAAARSRPTTRARRSRTSRACAAWRGRTRRRRCRPGAKGRAESGRPRAGEGRRTSQMGPFQPPDSVVFDLDGTLWDTCATCAVAWNQVLGRHGIAFRPITEHDVRRVTGRPHEECIRVVFTDVAEDDLLTLIAETQEEDNRMVGEHRGDALSGRRGRPPATSGALSRSSSSAIARRATSSASSTGRVSGAAFGTSSAGAIPDCPSRRTSPP